MSDVLSHEDPKILELSISVMAALRKHDPEIGHVIESLMRVMVGALSQIDPGEKDMVLTYVLETIQRGVVEEEGTNVDCEDLVQEELKKVN